MTKLLKTIIYILNFLILFSIIAFTILFYFQITNNFLSSFIVIICIITLLLKLSYWYSIGKYSEMIEITNKSNAFLLIILESVVLNIVINYILHIKNLNQFYM